MKYIPAEKLIAELRRQKHELELSIQSQGDYGQSCHIVAYENIISLIESIQQEQPSLPSNIDEAAKEYVEQFGYDRKQDGLAIDFAVGDFIAGAEWMAGRGVSMIIADETEWADVDLFVHRNCDGRTVIQIRRKEE